MSTKWASWTKGGIRVEVEGNAKCAESRRERLSQRSGLSEAAQLEVARASALQHKRARPAAAKKDSEPTAPCHDHAHKMSTYWASWTKGGVDAEIRDNMKCAESRRERLFQRSGLINAAQLEAAPTAAADA